MTELSAEDMAALGDYHADSMGGSDILAGRRAFQLGQPKPANCWPFLRLRGWHSAKAEFVAANAERYALQSFSGAFLAVYPGEPESIRWTFAALNLAALFDTAEQALTELERYQAAGHRLRFAVYGCKAVQVKHV